MRRVSPATWCTAPWWRRTTSPRTCAGTRPASGSAPTTTWCTTRCAAASSTTWSSPSTAASRRNGACAKAAAKRCKATTATAARAPALHVEVAHQGVEHADGVGGVEARAAHGAAMRIGYGALAMAGELARQRLDLAARHAAQRRVLVQCLEAGLLMQLGQRGADRQLGGLVRADRKS